MKLGNSCGKLCHLCQIFYGLASKILYQVGKIPDDNDQLVIND